MLTYDLKVGYSCNNRCSHCVIGGMKEKLIKDHKPYDLTSEECFNLIDEAVKKRATRIVLTGGEIGIRNDFHEILKKCAENNLEISIQTNGRSLSSSKLIEIIKPIENIDFAIALHGADKYTHDKVTNVSGSFDETCRGIKSMISIGKDVAIKVVISKYNQFQLLEIVRLAKLLNVASINFAFPHALGDAEKNFSTVIPTYGSLKNELNNVGDAARDACINVDFETIPFCIIPNHIDLVSELCFLKNETICTQVKEETYDWNNVRKKIKHKADSCVDCCFDNICEGIWTEYYEAFGDKELEPMLYKEGYNNLIKKGIDRYNN